MARIPTLWRHMTFLCTLKEATKLDCGDLGQKFFQGGQELKVVVNSGDLQKVVKKVPQICRHNVNMSQ